MEWYAYDAWVLVLLLPTVLVGIVTALIALRKVAAQKRTNCNLQLPPGPPSLPIIGHLHLLGALPHQSLYNLSKLHGPLMSLKLGSVSVVVASSPEMARQILQTHDHAFANRRPIAAANHIFGGCKDIAFSPPNTYWKLMRRLCATELFSSKGLHFVKPVRAEEIRALKRSVLTESVDASCKMNDRFGDATPQRIRPKLLEVTNNIITRMALGKKFQELGERQEGNSKASIVELLGEMNELLGMFNVGDFVPWLAWMDLQGCERRSKRVATDLRAAFEGVIQARRRLAGTTIGRPTSDFLDVLLQASNTTPIHIIEVLLDLFAAGTDTIAMTIEWALAELLVNPEKMRIVQAEIDEVVGRNRVIEEGDIQYLPYFLGCVKETMRLHPVVPLLVPHKTNEGCEILNFYIPPNTQAYVNAWAIGRDPKVWENPTKFSPERFLGITPTSTVDLQGQHFELLPFGSGRRMCPGWKLGLQTIHSILASLLQGFDWIVPPCEHLDISESFHLNVSLATPLTTYTSPRLPLELY